MDSLPVELLRLIYEYCDPPTVRRLRRVSPTLASVGYDYLIAPRFTALGWKDDVKRLHSIASHERLRTSIESVTFLFAKSDEYNASAPKDPWVQKVGAREQKVVSPEDYYRRFPSFSSQGCMVEDALKRLPKLRSVEVVHSECLDDANPFLVTKTNSRIEACKKIDVIVAAIRHCALSSLAIDQLPLELFKSPKDRIHRFDCSRSFASLSRLNLVLDVGPRALPQAKLRAVNGLGRVLRLSPDLRHLSLGFVNHANCWEKFYLCFRDLFGDFTFEKLTDLKLEGISCAESDLLSIILRHASTLERLRLGGRGATKVPEGGSMGGITLYEGTWRSFFGSLQGKLPKLKRFHMEGDMTCGENTPNSRAEVYFFDPITNDNWETTYPDPDRPMGRLMTADSRQLERYLLEGGKYPRPPRAGEMSREGSISPTGSV